MLAAKTCRAATVSTAEPRTEIFPRRFRQLRQREALLVAAASSLNRVRSDTMDDDRTEAVARQASHAAFHVSEPVSRLSSTRSHAEFQRASSENERGFGVSETCHYRCILLHRSAFIRSVWPEPNSEKPLFSRLKLVLPDRIELSTSSLPMKCSTTELRQRNRTCGNRR